MDYIIQITYPKSTTAAGISENSKKIWGSEIISNWESEVIFTKYFPHTKQKETVKADKNLTKSNVSIAEHGVIIEKKHNL
jgi:hypothetical protein